MRYNYAPGMSLGENFRVIAHRGDSRHAPENTMEAFALAVSAGADEIETDVRVTSDGVAVLCHDENLRRTTGADALVCKTPWAEIQALDVAVGFREKTGKHFPAARIVRLDEFFAEYFSRIHLQIELKAAEGAGSVLECIRQHAAFD